MARVRIPTPLRSYVEGNENVEVSADTVADAMDELTERYPELKNHLYENGKLRSFVNIFLGEEDVRYLNGMETELPDDAQLMIIPSIAGG